MNEIEKTDFRITFAQMADQAILRKSEIAALLATSDGAVCQMIFRGELPPTAFPEKRRACWFVRDIRAWLDEKSACRARIINSSFPTDVERRVGRPRSE